MGSKCIINSSYKSMQLCNIKRSSQRVGAVVITCKRCAPRCCSNMSVAREWDDRLTAGRRQTHVRYWTTSVLWCFFHRIHFGSEHEGDLITSGQPWARRPLTPGIKMRLEWPLTMASHFLALYANGHVCVVVLRQSDMTEQSVVNVFVCDREKERGRERWGERQRAGPGRGRLNQCATHSSAIK